MNRDFGPLSDKIVPISLREDVQVQIYGLPFDLTPAEAAKIARVITAFATASPTNPTGPVPGKPSNRQQEEVG